MTDIVKPHENQAGAIISWGLEALNFWCLGRMRFSTVPTLTGSAFGNGPPACYRRGQCQVALDLSLIPYGSAGTCGPLRNMRGPQSQIGTANGLSSPSADDRDEGASTPSRPPFASNPPD